MFFYFTSRIVCAISAFLYPGYASYKTLAQRPASEEDIERWLMYWSVVGCVVAAEYIAELLVSWIPFYYLVKMIFLLYLSLPQTHGSSYIYVKHLQPLLRNHEAQIDATFATIKARIYLFLQERLRMLWEHVAATVGQQPRTGQPDVTPRGGANNIGDPISGPAALFSNLWESYGPSIIAGGASLLRQGAAAVSTTGTRPDTTQTVLERRQQLEAELASLPPAEVLSTSVLASTSYQKSSRRSSDGDMRERSSGMRFEEIEVPSEVEGYDAGGGGGREQVGGRSSGWFGWASEKAKSD